MARYAYDVDTTQRYIDVHKQFQGGLKTVDTDDALGGVFLRQAENVSISEFGFLEKRYGTYENFKQTFSGNLQGYWEFEGYIIYAVDGDIFVNGTRVVEFLEEPGLRYPTNDNIPFYVEPVFTQTTVCSFIGSGDTFESTTDVSTSPACGAGVEKTVCLGFGSSWICQLQIGTLTTTSVQTSVTIVDHFQAERDMNAVNVNKVLYIFTGTYPIYAKVVSGELKFYLFPITVPTFDEIVVTGHNLLEDDYEGLYFENVENLPSNDGTLAAPTNFEEDDVIVQQKITNLPKIPYVRDSETLESSGQVKLISNFKFPSSILSTNYPTNNNYYELDIFNVGFRNSGSGASSLDYIDVNLDEVQYDVISNYNTSAGLSLFVEPEKKFANQIFVSNAIGSVIATKVSSISGVNAPFAKVKGDITTLIDKTYIEQNLNEKMYIALFHDTQDINGTKDIYSFEDFDALIGQESAGEPFSQVFADTAFLNTEGGYARGQKFVEITPYRLIGGAPSFFEDSKITINDVTMSNKNYVFTLPNTLNFEEVDGYKIGLSHIVVSFDDRTTTFWTNVFSETNFKKSARVLTTYPATYRYGPSGSPTTKTVLWNKTVGIINSLPTTNKNFVNNKFEATVKNLLSGTFDFIFRMTLTKYELQSGFLAIADTNYLDFIFPSITITEEKLQDYPGAIDYPTLKPIWTCNKVIEHFSKLMVWGSTAMPTAVFYSFPDRPTYFPSKFFLDFTNDQNSPVEAVSSYMNILVVQTRDQTWGIRGNSGLLTAPAPYAPFTINPTVGTIAYKSVRAVRNHLFFLSKQGIIALKSLYAADEQYNIEFVDRNIVNIVPRDDRAVGIQFDNQYWLNFPSYGITLRWYIDKKAWVLDKYTAWNQFNGVFKYQIVDGKLEFITRPSLFEGQNLGVYKIGIEEGLPSDLLKPIVSKFETSFLNQNYPFHPKRYKELKLDFTLQNEYVVAKAPIALTSTDSTNPGLGFTTQLKRNHIYQIVFDDFEVSLESVEPYDDEDNDAPYTAPVVISNISLLVGGVSVSATIQNGAIQFVVPASLATDTYAVTFSPTNLSGVTPFSVFDVTYDHEIDFDIVALSERDTLLVEEYTGYTPTIQIVDQNLGTRFGKIEFGNSGFGSLVTAVETIKLTGSGYNSKIFFEDSGKIKWTMESLGITYKMRRARSRI
jgi:hypothetical protein